MKPPLLGCLEVCSGSVVAVVDVAIAIAVVSVAVAAVVVVSEFVLHVEPGESFEVV